MSSTTQTTDRANEAGASARPRAAWADLKALTLQPRRFFGHRLKHPDSTRQLLAFRVLPLAAIRPVAVLVRSLVVASPLAGVVMGLGSLALQIGTWLGLSLVLPALARQFQVELDERQAFTLTTYASVPFWLAGLLYLVPEEPAMVFLWSRLLVALAALFSLFLMRQGLVTLELPRRAQMPLVGGIAAAGLLIYGLLFILFGISSHVALYLLG